MGEIKKIEDLLLAENLGTALCPPVVFSKMLAAHNLDILDHCLCSQKTTTKKKPTVLAYLQMLAKTIR